ncbi:MAG: hypothetical protein K2X87_07540, partial [Gemmataceae bacterium]|nr:hypothetical protein [Gemmataceae bacterium]
APAEAAHLRDRIDRLGRARPGLHRRPAAGPGPEWVPAYGSQPAFPALPPPPPLRQALYVHFWWGTQEFEVVASAAAVRAVVSPWPEGEWAGRKLAWLHCKGVRRSDLRPDGPDPAKVTYYLIPAHYITEVRDGGAFAAVPTGSEDYLGIFPPNQLPPVIAVPLDELQRVVAGLIDPAAG